MLGRSKLDTAKRFSSLHALPTDPRLLDASFEISFTFVGRFENFACVAFIANVRYSGSWRPQPCSTNPSHSPSPTKVRSEN
jgi:hypothetical protein